MNGKKLSRRDFLHMSALTAAGAALATCGPTPTPEVIEKVVTKEVEKVVTKEVEKVVTATPEPTAPPPEEVTLEIMASQPEYIDAERQVWDVFEAENAAIKVDLFSINEDQMAAFQAKVAGGYLPAIVGPWAVADEGITRDNYQTFMNLGELDFPWWDRWTYDVKNAFTDVYGLSGPRALEIFAGFLFTWQYRSGLMEEAGLDPRNDVKTWDDLKAFLEAGTAWANANPDVDYFWDMGWHNWVWGYNYMSVLPLAFADGQVEDQRKCWLGEAKFNDPDSPFRHTFEFLKEAYDEGWLPENCWTREWESDMEASFIANKSVMMLHGPWVWDKLLAADPTADQSGFPATPPAEGQETWMQYMSRLDVTARNGFCMLEGVQELPEWEQIKTAFYWMFSPPAVKMFAEVAGRDVLYKLDEPLEITGPQWLGVAKDIGTPGGLWEDTQYVDASQWGEIVAEAHRIGGTEGAWGWESNALVETVEGLLTGAMTVQDVLDLTQANYEASYEL